VSFRLRITLAAAAAVALAVALASALAYVLVENQLRGEVDSSLRQRAEAISERPFELERFFVGIPQPALGGAPGYLQLVNARGAGLRPTNEPLPLPTGKRVARVAAGEEGEFFSDEHVGDTHVRVITFQIDPVSQYALQIGLSLRQTDDVLGRLQWILFAIGGSGVVIAVILGWLVARAALAPVRRLTEATEQITATRDLSRRVEASDHDELGRLGASFNTMLAALEESQQAQRQLVADASHELRTPLTSLRTNVELLARGGLPADERSKALADVSTQLEELTELITDVVELARDGEREYTVEEVRLDLLVSDAVERAHLHAPERIFRAVANVLDNAAKWSPSGGKIEVQAADGEVTVRDHGPGIAPEDLPHVFDRFYRSPAARGTPGSGLGLAIVRQVVESHGGTVTAGPAEGGGTVVRLAFPNTNGSPNS
jgi:two-component system sensor histidine kinase MprB